MRYRLGVARFAVTEQHEFRLGWGSASLRMRSSPDLSRVREVNGQAQDAGDQGRSPGRSQDGQLGLGVLERVKLGDRRNGKPEDLAGAFRRSEPGTVSAILN
jgi:hypothetical protein